MNDNGSRPLIAWIWTPIALFLAASLAIGGVLAAAVAMRNAVRHADAIVTAEALSLGKVERLRTARERTSRKVRTFLLLGDERYLAEVRDSTQAFSNLFSELRRDAKSSPEISLINELTEREEARRGVTDRLIAFKKGGANTESLAHVLETDLQPVLDSLDTALEEMIALHQRKVEAARAESARTFSRATVALGGAAGVALLVAALASFALARTLRRTVGRAARMESERNRLFELSLDMVCIAGTDGFFKQLNPACEATLGYTRAELLAKPFLEFVHPDDQAATLELVAKLSRGESTVDFENRYRCKGGQYKWLSWHATTEFSGAIYAIARDVTERKAHEEKLAALNRELLVMAVIDELTGLRNRRGFNILVEQHLKHVQRTKQQVVFFFADLDGLKQINDQLGHDAGDAAIRDAANVIATAFRKSDIVARLGGDEFVALATDALSDSTDVIIGRVQELVAQYNASKPQPPFTLAISIGSTIHDPAIPETIDDILKRADRIMYEQKARRKALAVNTTG